jgi:hypothetical protein
MDFGEEVVMKSRRVVSAVLAVLFAVMLAAWVVAMPGEGTGLYALGIVVFGAACAACGTVAVRPVVLCKKQNAVGQPLKLRAITSRTS